MPASPYLSTRDDSLTEDPLIGFNYRIDVSGQIAGFFTECSGLGSEHEVVEHKAVDDLGKEVIRKIPGRLKWDKITLKRGITSDLKIWDWRQDVVEGNMDKARTNASIIMLDRSYKEVAQWDFHNAWPSKVSGPQLKSDSNAYGVEEVVLEHEGIVRVS